MVALVLLAVLPDTESLLNLYFLNYRPVVYVCPYRPKVCKGYASVSGDVDGERIRAACFPS